MKRDRLHSVGRIQRSHGRGGELKVRIYPGLDLKTSSPEKVFLQKGGAVEEFDVESFGLRNNVLILKLRGVDSLERAESLAGADILFPEGLLPPPAEGSYRLHQLLGIKVLTEDGHDVGRVKDVLSIPGNDLLVVEGRTGEVLIPFTQTICRRVDLAGGEVVIDPPNGLLELNEI